MKKITLLLSMVVAMVLSGCVKTDVPTTTGALHVRVPDAAVSRVEIAEGADRYSYTWKAGDQIAGLGIDLATGKFNGKVAYYTVVNPGAVTGHFDLSPGSTGFAAGEKFLVVHAKEAVDKLTGAVAGVSAITLPVAGAEIFTYKMPTLSKGAGSDMAEVGKHVMVVSDPVVVPASGPTEFELHHTMSLVKVALTGTGSVQGNVVKEVAMYSDPTAGDPFATILAIDANGDIRESASTWGKSVKVAVSDASCVLGSTAYNMHMLTSMKQSYTTGGDHYTAFIVKSLYEGTDPNETTIYKVPRVLTIGAVVPAAIECRYTDDFVPGEDLNIQEWDETPIEVDEDI